MTCFQMWNFHTWLKKANYLLLHNNVQFTCEIIYFSRVKTLDLMCKYSICMWNCDFSCVKRQISHATFCVLVYIWLQNPVSVKSTMYVFIWSVHKANWVVRNRGAVPLGHLNLTVFLYWIVLLTQLEFVVSGILKRFLYTHQCGANNLQVTQKKNQKTLLNRSIKTSSVWWVVFHPTVWFFSVWQNSSLSKANQGWKRDEGGDSGGVLTEWFGQMDGQRGRPLSAPSDLTRRDRKMEGRDGRRKWSEGKEEPACVFSPSVHLQKYMDQKTHNI